MRLVAARAPMAVALVIVVLAAVVACQRDESSPDPTVTGTPPASLPSSSPLDPIGAAERAALDAYRGMWAAFSVASQVGDPEHPELQMYASGDALDVLVTGLEANQREGLVSDGGEVALYPEVVEERPADAPTEVSISDCADTSNTRRVRPSGPPFTDSPGGWRQVTARVQLFDEVWKVTDFAVQEVGSCVRHD